MHPHLNKDAHYDAKKDLRNHPMLSKRPNPNIGILLTPYIYTYRN